MSRHSTGLSREERCGSDASDVDFCADTIEEFAVKNRISRSQTYKEIAAGRLIARKVGARTIITKEDGAAWRRALPKMPAAQSNVVWSLQRRGDRPDEGSENRGGTSRR